VCARHAPEIGHDFLAPLADEALAFVPGDVSAVEAEVGCQGARPPRPEKQKPV
jgi:hypothetical protein